MKYTILFVMAAFALSALWACSGSKNKVTTDVNEDGTVQKKVSYSPKLLSSKWKEVRRKDTYDGKWVDITEDNKVIEFGANGDYSEKHPGNDAATGTYRLEGDQVTTEHSGNNAPLTYKITYLDKKKLTLAIQGRHGKVFYDYVKVK